MKKLHMVFGFGIVMAMTGAALACGGHGKGAFGKADSNQDGKVSLAEALTAAKQRFDKWDANKNGVLEGDELKMRHGKGWGKKRGHEKA